MAINFSPNIANMSADDKAREYNRLRTQGYSDAAIRQAVDAQFGVQPEMDWSYLQGLAQRQNTTPQELANFQALSPQAKAQVYLQGLGSGQTDEQLRYKATGLFGSQTDTDWKNLQTAAQQLTAQQKADVYNRALNTGLSDSQIRANIDRSLGAQTDEGWAYLTQLAASRRGNTSGANSGGNLGFNPGSNTGGTAGANPFMPQALTNPFTYTPNPYLSDMAKSITSQVTDNLQRNILPGIGSAAVAAGGYGGSRQGVVEANALKDANQGLSNSLANLYGQDYNSAMSRGLQKYQGDQNYNMGLGNLGLGFQNSAQNYALGLGGLANQRYGQDQNYALGMGNLGLGYQNSLQNFYTAQRGQDMQGLQLGANLFQQGNTGMQQQGQGLYNLGLTQQQAPWNVVGNYTNTVSPFTGFGNTSTNTPGNALAGGLGGALVGAQLYNIFNKP